MSLAGAERGIAVMDSAQEMRRPVILTPALAGIVGMEDPGEAEGRVRTMLARMAYGQRYVSGRYLNDQLKLNLGWLSPKGSAPADFPVWNQAGDLGLIIFGELYDDNPETEGNAEPCSRLKTQAQELIRSFEKEDTAAFRHLNGWFGGVLIDLRRQRLIIFNDRYGLFRIHYHENSRGFHFSSEAKSIVAAVSETRELDYRSLAEFILCSCILQNRSMFSGISLLPGGSAWIFEKRGPAKKQKYFDSSEWEKQSPLGSEEYYDGLKKIWAAVLPRYFAGSQERGLSLTGGVDSRMILAWTPEGTGRLTCYTFAGRYRDSSDVNVARKLAELCGQPYEVICVDEKFFPLFPDLAENCILISDGTMDVTGTIDLFVQAAARQIAPVRITGTNGGEIMRSLVAFKPADLSLHLFADGFQDSLRAVSKTYTDELCANRLTFTAFKQVPWYMNTKFTLERSQVTLRMPYFDNDLVSFVYRAPAGHDSGNRLALRLVADGNPALARIGTDRGISLESASLLTMARHLLQQFTFKLEYAYDYGMPHWLARLDQYCSGLNLSRFILGRHKFHHFRTWYRSELSGYLKGVLLDPRTLQRPYLRGTVLERTVREHIAGKANYTREFHKILAAELTQRRLLEGN